MPSISVSKCNPLVASRGHVALFYGPGRKRNPYPEALRTPAVASFPACEFGKATAPDLGHPEDDEPPLAVEALVAFNFTFLGSLAVG